LKAEVLDFLGLGFRPLRISCEIVGISKGAPPWSGAFQQEPEKSTHYIMLPVVRKVHPSGSDHRNYNNGLGWVQRGS
jgi:hypothetical protein